MRLRCNLPDTLALRDGQPYAWFATNKVRSCVWEPAAVRVPAPAEPPCLPPNPPPGVHPTHHHACPSRQSLQEGHVVQRGAAQASFADVRAHLVACALDGATARCPPFVAIMRLADGTPKLLSRAALDALCDRLAAHLEAGERGDPQHTPALLQVQKPRSGWVPGMAATCSAAAM